MILGNYIPDYIHELPSYDFMEEIFNKVKHTTKVRKKSGIEIIERVCNNVKLRTMLSEAQNHRCALCGVLTNDIKNSKRKATIEHVIPKDRGGSNSWYNLAMTCSRCNNNRKTKYLEAEEFTCQELTGNRDFIER